MNCKFKGMYLCQGILAIVCSKSLLIAEVANRVKKIKNILSTFLLFTLPITFVTTTPVNHYLRNPSANEKAYS